MISFSGFIENCQSICVGFLQIVVKLAALYHQSRGLTMAGNISFALLI